MVPSGLSPRSISEELTPMAGTATATGGDAGSSSGPGAEVGAGAAGLSVGATGLALTGAGLGDGTADGGTVAGDDAVTAAGDVDVAAVVTAGIDASSDAVPHAASPARSIPTTSTRAAIPALLPTGFLGGGRIVSP